MSEFIAPPCHGVIEVLYQDEHILLINKPSGLLSLSGKNPLNKDSVHYRLVQDYPSATLLHRLDFGTSGIMLVALNKHVNGLLTQQFQQRTIAKTYTAMLQGLVADNEGVIDLPIAKDVDNFPLMKICHNTGKPAYSQYQVIDRHPKGESTKVIFTPVTGRTHQLRIHSLSMGHPILGCDLYRNEQSQQMSSRLLLHATTLDFIHPVTNTKMKCICTSPF
ncbi:pseudouridine synthase [Shewanella inventionis]|uniref:Dual-specificity RNA pseudouridine synthase RluA n=1 Tax=Shewanella inventionis TaxID=1738770 RepID=A0ABQ1JF85_9GAMM|nr:pseudouridine synthase [Shewanella inventionis]MCL1158276.1 pseudouridine synthase [Shewanella inventionis]GGB66912.1 RNA pseudouridine synthase [Shewanella inventionis]